MRFDKQTAARADRDSLFHPFTSVADHLRDGPLVMVEGSGALWEYAESVIRSVVEILLAVYRTPRRQTLSAASARSRWFVLSGQLLEKQVRSILRFTAGHGPAHLTNMSTQLYCICLNPDKIFTRNG